MRTSRTGVALAAATLLLTAGCGGDDTDSGTDAATGPSVAEETTADAEPTQEGPSADPDEGEPGGDVDPQAFGRSIIDAQLQAGTVHMEGSFGQGATMTGVMSFSGDKPAMDMKLSGAQTGGSDVHLIVVDGVMYVQAPGAGAGRRFLRIDADDMGANPLAKSLQSMDLRSSFRAFEAITALERVGQQTVAGVQTTHYEATVDTAESLRAQGIDPSQAAALPPEVTYDVWVGADDLIRKMVLGPAAGGAELVMTRWGDPVQISAPPPGRVQEMPRG